MHIDHVAPHSSIDSKTHDGVGGAGGVVEPWGSGSGPIVHELSSAAVDSSICPSCGQEGEGATCSCGSSLVLEERFRLEEELGVGTWGITYRARDLRSTDPVVVKRIDLSRARDPKQLQLVDRECAVLAQLDHPRIPRYVTHFRVGKGLTARLFLVQAFVEGKNLEQVLTEHRYTEAEVLDLVDELLAILEYLHGLTPPVIHRDVKPQNVIRESATGALWLLDFGAVREHVAGELGGSTVAGTFGYMAPEQFGGDATPASDLYAVGALAIRLATRVEPNRLLDHANRLVWRKRSGLGDAAAAFLDRLVEPDPARRIATARDARAKLAALRRGATSIVVRPNAKQWTAEPARSGVGPVWQVRSAATGKVTDLALGDLWAERRSGLFDQADEVRVADGPWVPFEHIPDLEAHAVEVYGAAGREIFRSATRARQRASTWVVLTGLAVLPILFALAVYESYEPASTPPVVQQPATPLPIVPSKNAVHYAPATPIQVIQSMMHNNPRLKQCVADSGLTDLVGVVVRFVPKPDGTGTTDISVSPKELRGSPLETCVVDLVGKMHFPSYEGEPIELSYELER